MLFLLSQQLVAYTTMPVDEFHTKLLQGFFGVLIDTREIDTEHRTFSLRGARVFQ